MKASILRSGVGSGNFGKVREYRTQAGLERDLAHKVDCGLSAIVTTACGTPLEELSGIRECLSHGDNLRMKTVRGNREVDRAGERIIASVARGCESIEELRKPAVRSKAKQMLRALYAGVFNEKQGDSVYVKENKARHRDVIKAVVQYSLKGSPDRDQYVLPRNNDVKAAEVLRALTADYKRSTTEDSVKVQKLLTPARALEPASDATPAGSSAKDPPASASSSSSTRRKSRSSASSAASKQVAMAAIKSSTVLRGSEGIARKLDFTASPTPTVKNTSQSRRSQKHEEQVMRTGPRGGSYYMNSNGNKTYVSKSSSSANKPASPSRSVTSAAFRKPVSTADHFSDRSLGVDSRTLHTGARGGTYFINGNGNRSYVSTSSSSSGYSVRPAAAAFVPQAFSGGSSSTSSYVGGSSRTGSGSGVSGGRTLHTGPRGGTYYINGNGNKTYVR